MPPLPSDAREDSEYDAGDDWEARPPPLEDDASYEVEHEEATRVRFDPESSPAAVLQLRYEYRDALISLGVLPAPDDPLVARYRAAIAKKKAARQRKRKERKGLRQAR